MARFFPSLTWADMHNMSVQRYILYHDIKQMNTTTPAPLQ